jgi:hypothetical protein
LKIGVIGAGVSGLTAAWRLARQHDVILFEREHRLGGHAHTHLVTVGGRAVPVDTGFMVFNERTYPNFVRMITELGVASRPSDMSFSVQCARCDVEYSSVGLRGLFAQGRQAFSTPHLAMLADVLRFFRAGRTALADGSAAPLTLAPSSTGTASARADATLRAADGRRDLVGVVARDARLPATSCCGSSKPRPAGRVRQPSGARSSAAASRAADRRALGGGVRVGTPATSVRRTASGAVVESAGAGAVEVDAVVLATTADEALALLADPSAAEVSALSPFRYSVNPTVLHGDARHLPARPAARASWNVRMADCRDEHLPVAVTYDLARLQGLEDAGPMLCTLNGGDIADPVYARMTYAHPILDRPALDAQQTVAALNGTRQTYFCGAHLRYGFHEDGVMSALAAVERLEGRAS